MNKSIVLFSLLLATVAGLAVAADPISELKSADQNWSKASEAKNLDQFMSFIADDVYATGPDGKWAHGKAAMRDGGSSLQADLDRGHSGRFQGWAFRLHAGHLPGQHGRQTDFGRLRHRMGERQRRKMASRGGHCCGRLTARAEGPSALAAIQT